MQFPTYYERASIAQLFMQVSIGSIAALFHGIKNRSMTEINYGTILLPFALSFYVRDDQSGGLLDKVKTNLINFISRLKYSTSDT